MDSDVADSDLVDLDVLDPDVVDSEVPGELVLEEAAVLEVVGPEGAGGRGKVLDGHGGKMGVEGLGDPGGTMENEDPGGKGGKVLEGLEIDGSVGIEGSGTDGPPEVDGSGLGVPVGNGDPGVVKELVPDESVLLEVLVEPALVSDDWLDGKLVCDTDADEELTGGELETEGLG